MIDWLRRLFAADPAPRIQAPAAAPRPAPARAASFADDWVTTMQRDRIDFMFASWLFEAEHHAEVFTSPHEDAILAELDAVLQSREAGAHLLRRLPGVIPQLLQSLRGGEFAGPELARKISGDLVLVAEVLRLANSVAYKPGTAITSVEHAVMILGQNGLRQLITSVAFKPIIDLRSGSFTRMVAPRLWEQSERCALANRMLSRGDAADPLDTFLAGLIQNVGLTVSLRVIDRMSDKGQAIGSPTFCNGLASIGRALACSIGADWHFPAPVLGAIREQGENKPADAMSPVGRILFMGDYLSKMDILARHGRLDTTDPRVLAGLQEEELECLAQLAGVEERVWLLPAAGARQPAAAGQ
ncbi:MAG TPA: HDOD domain-containing protein [Noviherbaspirillum sp.]|uniref:HDOD domain-containing protein n=1 Tax=Noviherbaspirillum sp. TaxID=1926288 RepID=UPI002F926299